MKCVVTSSYIEPESLLQKYVVGVNLITFSIKDSVSVVPFKVLTL